MLCLKKVRELAEGREDLEAVIRVAVRSDFHTKGVIEDEEEQVKLVLMIQNSLKSLLSFISADVVAILIFSSLS